MLISKVLIIILFTILPSANRAVLLDSIPVEQTVPDIHIKIKEVLKSCFVSRLSTLVITSDLDDVVRGVLDDDVLANIFVLDKNFNAFQSHRNFPRWPMFILTANSTKTLTIMLQQLKSSAFWSTESTYIVVGVPKGGCDRASRMLWKTWKMNLLASFYICEDLESQVSMYTYNPFTARAPNPWQRVETKSDQRWTLYSRSLSNDGDMCRFLEFDKTEEFDGYEINAATNLLPGETVTNIATVSMEDLTKKIFYESAMTHNVIWSKLNVTPIIHIDQTLYHFSDKEHSTFARKFDDKIYDVLMAAVIPEVLSEETFGYTYPFIMGSISILTNHRNFLTPAEKISNFYSFGVVSLTGLVFFVTWIIFIIQKKGKMPAALDILRMALSAGMLRPLKTIPIRIYLFGVLWLVLIVNATFQGNMSLFLTKPTRIDVRSVEDLKTYNYRVYVPELYRSAVSEFSRSIPENRIHYIKDALCSTYVINDTDAACIQSTGTMFSSAAKFGFHVSHKPVAKAYRTYPYRAGWPLAKKLNLYISRLMASGLLHHWRAKSEKYRLEELEAREAQDTAPVIRKIKLADLNFAFVILGIGLTIATIFFIIEVGGNPTKKRPRRIAKRRLLPQQRIIGKIVVHAIK